MKSVGRHYENDRISGGTIIANQCTALELLNKGGEKDMMGLYDIYVVNTRVNLEAGHDVIIAESEERAKFLAIKRLALPDNLDDLEFFANCIGQWESKKPKEVKIVKED